MEKVRRGRYVAYLAPNGDLLLDYNETLWRFGLPVSTKGDCVELERGETEGGPVLSKLYSALCSKYAEAMQDQARKYRPIKCISIVYDSAGNPHKAEIEVV